VLGFAFSALMDLWLWFSFYPHTWQALAATMARGVPFDIAHAAGNFVLALLIGPELRRVLERASLRLRTDVVWETAHARGGLGGHPAPPPASSVTRADARGVRGL
jgi:hypothetical protein